MKICETCYPILCGLQLQPPEAKITLTSWIYTEQTSQQKIVEQVFCSGFGTIYTVWLFLQRDEYASNAMLDHMFFSTRQVQYI